MSGTVAIERFQRNAVQLVWSRGVLGVPVINMLPSFPAKSSFGGKRIERRSSRDLYSCGASDNSARTTARAERRFGMASIARSNANANPDVSLELAISICVLVRRHLRTRPLLPRTTGKRRTSLKLYFQNLAHRTKCSPPGITAQPARAWSRSRTSTFHEIPHAKNDISNAHRTQQVLPNPYKNDSCS